MFHKTQKQNTPAEAKKSSAGLGVMALAAIVVSSMIGGGIYSLPQNMAQSASAGAVLLAWLITGIGVYFIANTFRILSVAKPDLTAGIYMYSREGFGSYAGFTIGWSYWLCQICGNVGYAVITMDALNYFFPPHFAGGNNLASIIGGSLIIWGFNFLVLRGIKQATLINLIGTVAKIVPLVLFILIMAFVFHADKFSFDFWGENLISKNLGSIESQIKNTMLVTLWSFIGIEGAVVMSQHAKSPKSVGKATVLGFAGCLLIYVLLSLLPFGYMSQSELAKIANPSTAGILEKIVGKWGADFMNIGLLVSVLTSWLAWTMVTAQIPQAAAENGTFPKQFAIENEFHAPSVSLWVTSAMMQIFMLLVYFSNNAWNTMLSITGVMVLPAYFSSCAYLWKLCEDHEYPKDVYIKRSSALLAATVGSIYALWLIYAAGLKYLLAAVVFIALGIPVYIWARTQNCPDDKIFTKHEFCFAVCLVILALVAIYAMTTGIIKL
ncbi:MAG TPA: arginine:agmatine antiporter [Alphaproteobacteria bacterium]|nr:arginine:agmatine antiporter [Alphaproteobacteria bacterium]